MRGLLTQSLETAARDAKGWRQVVLPEVPPGQPPEPSPASWATGPDHDFSSAPGDRVTQGRVGAAGGYMSRPTILTLGGVGVSS